MILLNIQYSDSSLTPVLAKKLLDEKLVTEISEVKPVNLLSLEKNQLVSNPSVLMTAVTKSLLFSKIADSLKEIATDDTIKLYALPVVHVDFGKSASAFNELQRV